MAKIRRKTSHYVFTPARRAALAKAREASIRSRKRRAKRAYSSDRKARGVGVSGLKKNTVPYARVNKRSQTLGVNAGTIIPRTNKRIAIGAYIRVENVNRKGAIDRALSKGGNIVAPRGTRRGKVRQFVRQNVKVNNPALRASVSGSQVRLGTSRQAGPTVIVRKGKHPTPWIKSRAGVKKYDNRMRVLENRRKRKKKPRPQRRGRN